MPVSLKKKKRKIIYMKQKDNTYIVAFSEPSVNRIINKISKVNIIFNIKRPRRKYFRV